MKLTEYNEKLCFLCLDNNSEFLDIRAAGRVEPDENYMPGQIPSGYMLVEYIISGKVSVSLGGERRAVSEGELLILFPQDGAPEYKITSGAPICKLWMTLRGRYVFHLTSLYGVKLPLDSVLSHECEPVMRYIVDYLAGFGFHELEVSHMLLDLFDRAFNTERHAREPTLADRVRRVLDRHLEKPVRISDVAAYFCKSERTIERAFEQKFGISAYEYLRSQRLAAAARELRSTDELVYVIAARFQLGSSGFFASEFKKCFGMTPNQYRKQRGAHSSICDAPEYETIYDYIPMNSQY